MATSPALRWASWTRFEGSSPHSCTSWTILDERQLRLWRLRRGALGEAAVTAATGIHGERIDAARAKEQKPALGSLTVVAPGTAEVTWPAKRR